MDKYITLPSKMNDMELWDVMNLPDNSVSLLCRWASKLNLSASEEFKQAVAYECMVEVNNRLYGAENIKLSLNTGGYSRYRREKGGKDIVFIQHKDKRVVQAMAFNFMATLPDSPEST